MSKIRNVFMIKYSESLYCSRCYWIQNCYLGLHKKLFVDWFNLLQSQVKVKRFYSAKTYMFIAINNTYKKAWNEWTKHEKHGKY